MSKKRAWDRIGCIQAVLNHLRGKELEPSERELVLRLREEQDRLYRWVLVVRD